MGRPSPPNSPRTAARFSSTGRHVRTGIAVDVADVADPLVGPAAGVVDQAGRVVRLRPGGDALGVVLAPALVERHPHHDRGMGDQGVHDGLPFALELGVPGRQGFGRVRIALVEGARHVLPDEEAQLVAPVVEPVGLDLDVLPEHVHAQGLDRLDVVAQGRVGRGRVEPVRPPALVERPELEERLVVQEEPVESLPVLADGDLAHPGVARDLVQDPAVLPERGLDVI